MTVTGLTGRGCLGCRLTPEVTVVTGETITLRCTTTLPLRMPGPVAVAVEAARNEGSPKRRRTTVAHRMRHVCLARGALCPFYDSMISYWHKRQILPLSTYLDPTPFAARYRRWPRRVQCVERRYGLSRRRIIRPNIWIDLQRQLTISSILTDFLHPQPGAGCPRAAQSTPLWQTHAAPNSRRPGASPGRGFSWNALLSSKSRGSFGQLVSYTRLLKPNATFGLLRRMAVFSDALKPISFA